MNLKDDFHRTNRNNFSKYEQNDFKKWNTEIKVLKEALKLSHRTKRCKLFLLEKLSSRFFLPFSSSDFEILLKGSFELSTLFEFTKNSIIYFSFKAKYVASNNLGGSMIWHIGGDDVSGDCGPKQQLLKIINEEMKQNGWLIWNQ